MNAKLYEETINQLKQENVELRCRLQTVNEECILLDKENRDLKCELLSLKEIIDYYENVLIEELKANYLEESYDV